jgi:hypothetical protein
MQLTGKAKDQIRVALFTWITFVAVLLVVFNIVMPAEIPVTLPGGGYNQQQQQQPETQAAQENNAPQQEAYTSGEGQQPVVAAEPENNIVVLEPVAESGEGQQPVVAESGRATPVLLFAVAAVVIGAIGAGAYFGRGHIARGVEAVKARFAGGGMWESGENGDDYGPDDEPEAEDFGAYSELAEMEPEAQSLVVPKLEEAATDEPEGLAYFIAQPKEDAAPEVLEPEPDSELARYKRFERLMDEVNTLAELIFEEANKQGVEAPDELVAMELSEDWPAEPDVLEEETRRLKEKRNAQRDYGEKLVGVRHEGGVGNIEQEEAQVDEHEEEDPFLDAVVRALHLMKSSEFVFFPKKGNPNQKLTYVVTARFLDAVCEKYSGVSKMRIIELLCNRGISTGEQTSYLGQRCLKLYSDQYNLLTGADSA